MSVSLASLQSVTEDPVHEAGLPGGCRDAVMPGPGSRGGGRVISPGDAQRGSHRSSGGRPVQQREQQVQSAEEEGSPGLGAGGRSRVRMGRGSG